jgi:acetyl esterase/lipase
MRRGLFRLLRAFPIALAAAWPADAVAQRVLTFDDVLALPSRAPDHRIAWGPGPLQFGNLRLPRGSGPHPVVIFIHGGCWLSEYSIAHVAPLEQALADSGFAVWSLEYRRVGDDGGGWPGTFLDIGRGADHLRTLAAAHALDLRRVIAMGHSAGGQLALWLAGRHSIPSESELHAGDPLPVQSVLGLAPAPDLEGLFAAGTCGNVVASLMGGSPSARPERYGAASPMRMAPLGVPQALVVGALDRSWAPAGRAYYWHARTAGDSLVQLVEAPASAHFDMIAPTTSTWPLVLRVLRELLGRIRS